MTSQDASFPADNRCFSSRAGDRYRAENFSVFAGEREESWGGFLELGRKMNTATLLISNQSNSLFGKRWRFLSRSIDMSAAMFVWEWPAPRGVSTPKSVYGEKQNSSKLFSGNSPGDTK